MNNTQNLHFEQIKKINEAGKEYWLARSLAKILEYKDFTNFENVIAKAKLSCKNSFQDASNHFREVTEMVQIGSGATRIIHDYQLSRYACYLIMQNADPAKDIVALGQTYFAIQTRKQEIHEQHLEDQKRLYLRNEISHHNKKLAKTAKSVGVNNYGEFTDYGYMGLYGGLRAKDIHQRKRLKPKQKILDYMDSEELGANIFRATQTNAKLKKENIRGQINASKTHFDIGKKIRQTIKEIGGTMPEKLPTPENITETKKRIHQTKNKKKGKLGHSSCCVC